MSARCIARHRPLEPDRQSRRRTLDAARLLLADVPIPELERLAGLAADDRTGFWLRYAFTPNFQVIEAAGTGALLARIAERVRRGELTLLARGGGHG